MPLMSPFLNNPNKIAEIISLEQALLAICITSFTIGLRIRLNSRSRKYYWLFLISWLGIFIM